MQQEQELIDYDHLELEDPSAAQGLLSTDALKLGAGSNSNGLGAISNSTTGFMEND